eukprot:3616351-Amphidinium_carterae.4
MHVKAMQEVCRVHLDRPGKAVMLQSAGQAKKSVQHCRCIELWISGVCTTCCAGCMEGRMAVVHDLGTEFLREAVDGWERMGISIKVAALQRYFI